MGPHWINEKLIVGCRLKQVESNTGWVKIKVQVRKIPYVRVVDRCEEVWTVKTDVDVNTGVGAGGGHGRGGGGRHHHQRAYSFIAQK